MEDLLKDIRACTLCAAHLAQGPRPVVSASPSARLLIIGQAPGARVHESGVPWDDASGNNLRDWLGIDRAVFYDDARIALVPMGFCYPGKGRSGDLPPRPECAPAWHSALLGMMREVRLTLLVGQYAQNYYLKGRQKANLTQTVMVWREYLPDYLPLPHPSPRNNIWQKKNPWFAAELLPGLRRLVEAALR